MSDEAKSKAKQKWAIEKKKKQKLDNARQLRGIFFIEPEDDESRHIIKNARRKLETPMPAAMPCKTLVNCRGETCCSIGKSKTNNACIVDVDETMRIGVEGVPHRNYEDHPISAKDQSRLHQFGAKVLPGILLGYLLHAGGIWKGDIKVADIEELEDMDASELHTRRLNAKEVVTPQRSGNFIFSVADGTVKIFRREQRLRTSTLNPRASGTR